MNSPDFTGEFIPATKLASEEAETLSSGILEDLEYNQADLSIIGFKVLRLARLLNDFEAQQLFEWECGGYPLNLNGKVDRNVWEAAREAGRAYFDRGSKSKAPSESIFRHSIEELEQIISTGKISLEVSSNPPERRYAQKRVLEASGWLSSRRTFVYKYVLQKNYELRFGGLVDDVFGRVRSSVDSSINLTVPAAVRKLTAVYDNLSSDNPEDWANAVHSCRRVLQDLADSVFPAQSEPLIRKVNGEERKIKLGTDQYINRLVIYIENMSESGRFVEIVGSHLKYMGDRLDALFHAAQKGSHAAVTKDEADRCVIYTYLLVGDILSLDTPQVGSADGGVEVAQSEIV